MVGRVARPEPGRGELAGEAALGDGGTVGVIAHSGFPSLTGILSWLTRYPSCDSQIKMLATSREQRLDHGLLLASRR